VARRSEALQILVAVPNRNVARRIADALLDARLVACAQTLGPMTSRYTWKGKREAQREWLLLLKTRRALASRVEAVVRALHPYEVPEIAGTKLSPVNAAYLAWLERETSPPISPQPRRARRGFQTPSKT
jgi:periplasmic divalent cation tolerance protein